MDDYIENHIFSYYWSNMHYNNVTIPLIRVRKRMYMFVDFIRLHILYNTSPSVQPLAHYLKIYNHFLKSCVKDKCIVIFLQSEFPWIVDFGNNESLKKVKNVKDEFKFVCLYVLCLSGQWSHRVVRLFSSLE